MNISHKPRKQRFYFKVSVLDIKKIKDFMIILIKRNRSQNQAELIEFTPLEQDRSKNTKISFEKISPICNDEESSLFKGLVTIEQEKSIVKYPIIGELKFNNEISWYSFT